MNATTDGGWVRRGANWFGMDATEFAVAMGFFLLLIPFKIINTAVYKFDSDESQHLHVIWGWARGFLEYRDMCDNHMPLFHLIFAPIYGVIGDRPMVLHIMRFILLPLYAVSFWCTYRLGTLAFSRRVGLWAALLVAFYPGNHFCSLEFRTDNLWTPLWLLAVVTLFENGLTYRTAWTAGILLGLCFGISMKTTLLLLSMLVGVGAALVLVRPRKLGVPPRRLPGFSVILIGCALLVPAIIMVAFAYAGLWPQFRYWVFENNIVPGLRNHPRWWMVAFPLIFPVVLVFASRFVRRTPDPAMAFRQAFLLVVWGFYIPFAWSFWPQVSRQDYLPYQPLAFCVYAAGLVGLTDSLVTTRSAFTPILRWAPLVGLMALGFFLVALLAHPFWVNGAQSQDDLMRAVLKLTDPGDFVLDEKGETVFRQRVFPAIWEPMVMERIRRGWMKDDAPERCAEKGVCVATKEKDMSKRASEFVASYFVPVTDRLYVAGARLQLPTDPASGTQFSIGVPAPYKLVSHDTAPVEGTLDGRAYAGEARNLTVGLHTFSATKPYYGLAILWAQAVDRGFGPL